MFCKVFHTRKSVFLRVQGHGLEVTSFLKASFVQQAAEIEIKTRYQGICFWMLPWFYIQFPNFVLLVTDKGTCCSQQRTSVQARSCCKTLPLWYWSRTLCAFEETRSRLGNCWQFVSWQAWYVSKGFMVHCLKSKQFPLLAGLHVLPAKCHLFSFVICIIFDCKSSFIYIYF